MEHFVWNIDPEIFRIGSFGPRYYGLMFALGFLVGYHLMQKTFEREGKNIEDLSSLLLHSMLGTIIGARFGHCLFYEPAYYLSNPLQMLFIWKGGLASHGGGLGVIIGVWLYQRKHKDQSFMWLADRFAAPLAFTAGCIRLGNFFNSEIIGRASDVPWAIVFERIDNIPRHPAMLYESITYFITFIILQLLYHKKGAETREGTLIGLLFISAWGSRIFLEFFKENQVAFEDGMFMNMGQILSIPYVIAGFVFLLGYHQKIIAMFTQPAANAAASSENDSNKRDMQKKMNKKTKKRK